MRIGYGKVCKITGERILKEKWRERFGDEEDDFEENLEDLEECGEDKENTILGVILDKLNNDWFNKTSEDEDDLEGTLDYLKPRSYDGFIDLDDEAYNKRRCKWLGMTYEEPNPILIEKLKLLDTSLVLARPIQRLRNYASVPFIPMIDGQRKPEGQWTRDERKTANLDQRLKSLIMSVLPDDQMNSVINCLIAKSTWNDLILYHEGPYDVKESRVMDLKLCYNTFKFKEDYELASLFGKLKYEEHLIDNIYKTEKNKSLVSATSLSTAFISTSIVQDFQDSPDDEEDTRSSHEYLNELEEEYQARALLAKSKRFFKKGTQRFISAKATDQTECHKCGKKELRPTKDFEAKYNKVKAKLALLSSSASASKPATVKNKGLIVEAYEWDEEEASSDDNKMVEVKVLMTLAEENDAVSKEGAKNGEWVKIFMRKYDIKKPINNILVNFCDEKGISQNFSSPYTPEQNGVAERKNRTLIKAARIMLSGFVFLKQYWTEAIATACYTQNRSTIVKRHIKTPYEIFCKRIPNINFLYVFGCPVYIHNHKDYLGKFDEKADDSYLLGYSLVSKAFKLHQTVWSQDKHIELVNIIGNLGAGMLTRSMAKDLGATSAHECLFVVFLFEKEPKKVSEALQHPGWVDAMQDELKQFTKNKV
ncbi:retrovirus-related pol polyprotein from transposon TNT 1-94 [Tanacetum coccineum]